jgi:microtubule-associated protein-like 6
MGGDPTQATKDGAFVVVDSKTLEILFEDRKAKLYLTDIKFSPKGDIIAMTSADSKIYIHAIENFAHIRTISTPTKSCIVSRVDFSDDGATLRCCTDKDELYHITMSTGDIITSPLAARDFKWASDTCIYTYSSHGFWRPAPDGINVLSVAVNAKKDTAAVSYQNGEIRLYQFPCTSHKDALFKVIPGIATQTSRMAFSADNRYIVVLDTFCRTILVWNLAPVL